MNINDLVIFLGENSTPYQEQVAKKSLKVGEIYKIEKVVDGNWFSFLVLKGIRGQFAIEMFEKIEEAVV